MGAIFPTRRWGACALAALMTSAISGASMAQTALPQINVTDTRLTGIAAAGGSGAVPDGGGITGASTSIITRETIERSPFESLQDLIAREAGVQTTSVFGGVAGARTVLDIRGFGAAAPSNTLVLINGRRVTDLDLGGVDFTALPRDSIERIEITRGNSGAVLYGDNAVGGVVNIVTKNAVGLPPSARVEAGFGSFGQREGSASANASNGPFSASVYANAINSDGYRINNALRQRNAVGDFRYTTEQGGAYLNLSADDQHLGFPSFRRVEPSLNINQLVTDRRGTITPFDYGDKQGLNLTAGVTRKFGDSTEVILDGGVRQKLQQTSAFLTGLENYVDTTLTTTSFTPRVINGHNLFGLPGKIIAGADIYDAQYDSDRGLRKGDAPIHRYDLRQRTFALYAQETIALLPGTDLSFGGRREKTSLSARDSFDPDAPGSVPFFFGFPVDTQGIPLDNSEYNNAFHLGAEHRFNQNLAVFGRMAQSFRVPNVDERVGMVAAMTGIPTTFDLRTQKSHDREIGVRVKAGPLDVQWSIYDMRLTDEIHFRFGPDFVSDNTNLDPTRRYGHETIAKYRLTDTVRLTGNLAYTRSVFREGIFAGNDVPLVSKWTGNVGVAWDIWDKKLVFDGVVRYVGSRRMDNDQSNLQPLIPSFTVVDVRLGGAYENFFWSASIQNLFNEKYFDYAVASPFPFGFGSRLGTYNAYPQPGRSYLVRAGMKW